MTVATPTGASVVVEGVEVSEAVISQMTNNVKDWFAQNCGLAATTDLESASYGGMGYVKSVQHALAIRILAYRNVRGYRTGYVIASSTDGQERNNPKIRECMLAAGFKVLDTYVNPAHNSNAVITIWGAQSIKA